MSRAISAGFVALCVFASGMCAEEAGAGSSIKVSEAGETNLNSIYFADAQSGWIVGDNGLCLLTADGGSTWAKQSTNSNANLHCIRFKGPSNGFACGEGDATAPTSKARTNPGRPYASATLLSTTDGGKTWKAEWIDTNAVLTSLELSSPDAVLLGLNFGDKQGAGEILKVEGSGHRLQDVNSFRQVNDIRALDGQNFILAGGPIFERFYPVPADAAFANKAARVLFSRDGGNTWNAGKTSDGRVPLRGIAVKIGAPVVVVGDQGNIVISIDQGATWKPIETPNHNDLFAAAWSPSLPVVVAVGKGAMCVYSNDAGKSWKTLAVAAPGLRSIAAAGDSFFAVGEKGSILRIDAKDLK